MSHQANGTLDVSAEVKKQLGLLTWENLVLRAQIQELQAKLSAAAASADPRQESKQEYMTIPETPCPD